MMPDLSAKVFRTYNASSTLQSELEKSEFKKTTSEDEKVKFYDKANREVAILCNHQKAVAKNFEESLKNAKDKLSER